MTSEGYPNGMTASYNHNTAGEATGLTYEKTTHCTEKCIWFSRKPNAIDSRSGLEQASTLAKTGDTYDEAGRLTQVQETPTGEGCTTRIYAYEAETNRAVSPPTNPTPKTNARPKAAPKKNTVTTQQTGSPTPASNTTNSATSPELPAADAGLAPNSEHATTPTSNWPSKNQNGQTIGYNLDPAGRPLETVDTGKIASTSSTTTPGRATRPRGP